MAMANWSDRMRRTAPRGAILGSAKQAAPITGQMDGTEREGSMDVETLVHRVCSEFIEMPGLRLTFAQAVRLWGLTPAVCRRVMDELIDVGFLRQTPTGMLVRADCE
jgi:hypothetical protein